MSYRLPFVRFKKSIAHKPDAIARGMGVPDIVSLIALELNVRDLASLSRVCMCYSGIAMRELRIRVYNVLKRHVSQWVKPLKTNLSFPIVDRIKAFLNVLHENRAVISGLAALCVLMSHSVIECRGSSGQKGKVYGDDLAKNLSELEIFTPKNRASPIITYLNEVEDYVVDTPAIYVLNAPGFSSLTEWDSQIEYWKHRTTVDTATRLKRRSDGQRIYVIESRHFSALSPISQVSSTLTCNWLDLHGITCAYPRYTFRGFGTYNPTYSERESLQYGPTRTLRGYNTRMFEHETRKCKRWQTYCPRRRRATEDAMTFHMALWHQDDVENKHRLTHHRTFTHFPRMMWIWGDWDHHDTHDRPYVPCSYGPLEPLKDFWHWH